MSDQEAIDELMRLAWQYRNDLRHPPARDSISRRLEWINKTLDKIEARKNTPPSGGTD